MRPWHQRLLGKRGSSSTLTSSQLTSDELALTSTIAIINSMHAPITRSCSHSKNAFKACALQQPAPEQATSKHNCPFLLSMSCLRSIQDNPVLSETGGLCLRPQACTAITFCPQQALRGGFALQAPPPQQAAPAPAPAPSPSPPSQPAAAPPTPAPAVPSSPPPPAKVEGVEVGTPRVYGISMCALLHNISTAQDMHPCLGCACC